MPDSLTFIRSYDTAGEMATFREPCLTVVNTRRAGKNRDWNLILTEQRNLLAKTCTPAWLERRGCCKTWNFERSKMKHWNVFKF